MALLLGSLRFRRMGKQAGSLGRSSASYLRGWVTGESCVRGSSPGSQLFLRAFASATALLSHVGPQCFSSFGVAGRC